MTDPLAEPSFWHVEADSLSEVVDDRAGLDARVAELREQAAHPEDDVAELLALGDLVDLLRIGGDLEAATREAARAVARAELVGTPAQTHLARLRQVTVGSTGGEPQDAAIASLVDAAGEFGPVIAALTHQAAGRYFYDRDDFDTATGHFRVALQLREGLQLDETAESRRALELARRRGSR